MRNRWTLRLIFGLLVFVFVDLIAWYDTERELIDWLAVLVLDVMLAALVLDLMIRWHTNTWLSLLIAAGLFGVLHGNLVSNAIALNLPISILIFGSGMPTLLFLAAWCTFSYLYCGQKFSANLLRGIAGLLGIAHALWLLGLPTLDNILVTEIEISTTLPIIVIFLVGIALFDYFLELPSDNIQHNDWLHTPVEWTAVLLPLIISFFVRISAVDFEVFPWLLSGIVVAILVLLLWFYYGLTLRPNFRLRFQTHPQKIIHWMIALAFFASAAWLSYMLILNDKDIPITVFFVAIVIWGAIWPPLISIFVSMQAFIELGRQEY